MHHMRKDFSSRIFDVLKYVILTLVALICVFPFIVIIVGSLTENDAIAKFGFSVIPRILDPASETPKAIFGTSMEAYNMIFRAPQGIIQAYKMNFYYTIVGTTIGLAMITMTAYVISRKEFKYRNRVSFLIYFTSIFGGGMLPWWLMYTTVLGLKGNPLAIWFPALMTPFLVILMRTFITASVPDAITEAAKIDGAGHVRIFAQVVLPVLGPGIATVGLFLALGYWNDWYRASMFSVKSTTWQLQFYLYNMVNAAQAIQEMSRGSGIPTGSIPSYSVRLAMAVVSTGPVLLFYPFVQRYFVSGITVGAVKG